MSTAEINTKKDQGWAKFREGQRDAVPIGLGYFAVSFALGITMKNAGLTPIQGFFITLPPIWAS